SAPLLVEHELDHAARRQISGKLFASVGDGVGVAASQCFGPLLPDAQVIALAQGIEEDEVFEPPFIFAAKLLEARERRLWSVVQEIGSRLGEQRKFMTAHLVVIDRAYGIRKAIERGGINPAMLSQAFEADEQRIAREGRGRRVWRVAVGR